MNEALRQRFPEATPQELAYAEVELERLRQAIAQFQQARLKTGELRAGLRPAKVPPAEVASHLTRYRDPAAERQTVEDLRAFLTGLYGRAPSPDELEAGVPPDEALGLLPLLIAVPAIVGGAAVLTEAFRFLTAREETALATIQSEHPEINAPWYSRLWTSAQGPIRTVAIVGTIGAAGYLVWELWAKKKVETAGGVAKALVGKKNPAEPSADAEGEEEDEDLEDEEGHEDEESGEDEASDSETESEAADERD